MFSDLKKKREDAAVAANQAQTEEEKALAELGQLQRERYEVLTPIVQEVLTQYNEAMGLNASIKGRFDDPCGQYKLRTTYNRQIAKWDLVCEYHDDPWPESSIMLITDEEGIPAHFLVYVYHKYPESLETPDMSQKSLVQTLRKLCELP